MRQRVLRVEMSARCDNDYSAERRAAAVEAEARRHMNLPTP
jgi:hypothetical protein